MSTKRIATLAAAALAAAALAGPAQALGAPVLGLQMTHQLPQVPTGGYGLYEIVVSNSGNVQTSGKVTVGVTLPAGLQATSVTDQIKKATGSISAWSCTIAAGAQSVSCDGPSTTVGRPILPGQEACVSGGLAQSCHILIVVKADPGLTPGTILTTTATACGGGVTTCPTVATSASDPTEIGTLPAFGLTSFDGSALKSNGDPATQAGSHPFTASTDFFLTTKIAANGSEVSTQDLQDAVVELPPGLVGNPQALGTCSQAQLASGGEISDCPPESQIGVVTLYFNGTYGTPGNPVTEPIPIYNMQAARGTPALLGFSAGGAPIQVYAKLRSGEDYGVTVISKNAPQTLPIAGAKFSVWGVPADPSHDSERGSCVATSAADTCPSSSPLKPFFTLPTSCVGPVETFLDITSWQGGEAGASFLSHGNGGPGDLLGADGCNALDYTSPDTAPTLQARPSTTVADAPSGLDVDLHIPQNENPNGNAEAHLKDTTVTLPEGLVVNPSAANGLGACSQAQFGYTSTDPDGTIHTTPDPATCPDDSKLGTVEVDSPLLDHPLQGAAYIATPHQNPFASLLALYITIDDPQTGVVVKLAGKVTPDPQTGRLTATFNDNPQLPFEHFLLHFKGGPHGALRTPAVCGNYTTTSSLTPWSAPDSGPPATPSDPWTISQGPNGGACANSAGEEPNSPSLDAGTVSPIAGAFSPMVINLRREDGSQNFSTVTLTPPPGLIGRLAGTPYCPEDALATAAANTGRQETASPSCPSASQIGTVDVAAGAGPAPYNAQGKAYLSGPYKGAPLSLAIVTPATAGPFDLGTVVVRTALHIDPSTAQITATSDPIPSILQGIPLDVRSALVKLDKPNFTLNGTSCNPMSFTGSLLSTLNQAAPLSVPFQLAECSSLGFKPSLKLSLKGGTKRNGHPAFTSVLNYPSGAYANLAKAQVTLPPTMQLDQSHIQAPCTRPQFAANQCPAASIIGTATATSPLVDYQLSGPVYLRTGNNPLPDIVLALRGPASQPIEIDVVGKVDTVHARLRTTFETVPDAPVSQAVISLQGQSKGLLVNNTNLCAKKNIATVQLEGQNGKVADSTPKVGVAGCPKHHKPHKHHKRHHLRHGAR